MIRWLSMYLNADYEKSSSLILSSVYLCDLEKCFFTLLCLWKARICAKSMSGDDSSTSAQSASI